MQENGIIKTVMDSISYQNLSYIVKVYIFICFTDTKTLPNVYLDRVLELASAMQKGSSPMHMKLMSK